MKKWIYNIDYCYNSLSGKTFEELKNILSEHRERLYEAQEEKNAMISAILQTQQIIKNEKI